MNLFLDFSSTFWINKHIFVFYSVVRDICLSFLFVYQHFSSFDFTFKNTFSVGFFQKEKKPVFTSQNRLKFENNL